jgi:hypothetical protein
MKMAQEANHMRIMTILAVLSLLLFMFTTSCTPPPPQTGEENQTQAEQDERGNVEAQGEEQTETPAGETGEETTEATGSAAEEDMEEGFTEMDLPPDWVQEVKLPTGVHIIDYSRTEDSMHAAGYVDAPINRVFTFVVDLKNVLDWGQTRENEWIREGTVRRAYYDRPGMNLEITITEVDPERTDIDMDLTME